MLLCQIMAHARPEIQRPVPARCLQNFPQAGQQVSFRLRDSLPLPWL
jgi:hypothetical protein